MAVVKQVSRDRSCRLHVTVKAAKTDLFQPITSTTSINVGDFSLVVLMLGVVHIMYIYIHNTMICTP